MPYVSYLQDILCYIVMWHDMECSWYWLYDICGILHKLVMLLKWDCHYYSK